MSLVKNKKVVAILYFSDFNQYHIATWQGTNKNEYNELVNSLPINFKMSGSYGSKLFGGCLQKEYNLLTK